jgi:hypothetical protein
MASISKIKTDLTSFSDYELQELLNYIGEILSLSSVKSSINEEFRELILVREKSVHIAILPLLLKMVN